MARSVTVQKIVDEAQVLCQDPDHALATEAQYVSMVNDEHARLYAMYVAAEPDRYRTEATITALAATSAYALPADWLATVAIDYASGNTRTELDRLPEHDRNVYVGQTGTSKAFRVIGTNVVLYPTPNVGETYTHIYIPTAPVLSSVATSIDCRLGHDKWLQMCVARTLLKTEETYDGRWDDEIAKVEADLKVEANYRYFNDCVTMQARQGQQHRKWPYGTSMPWPFGGRW
jgi:hypothetical protein